MKKKILVIFYIITVLISCSGVSIDSKYNAKQISAIAAKYVLKEGGEYVGYDNARIYKKGYGKWYLILYGLEAVYRLEVSEEGKIEKYEKTDYIN